MSQLKASKKRTGVPAAERLGRKILQYLESHHAMTLASCQRNFPWAAAVFFANDGFDLYFFSNPRSRHGVNIAANRKVSAAIHEDYRHWREIRGIQLEGHAELLRSRKLRARFWEVYRKKFPFVEDFFREGPLREELRSKLAGIRLYRLVPTTAWYLDNSRGFGHREKLELSKRGSR